MAASRPLAHVEVFGSRITLVDVITAAAILVAALGLSFLLRTLILRYSANQQNARRATWYTVSRLAGYTVITIGVLAAVAALGVPLSRFEVLAGALGVGLGFGLQTIFSNFVSGLILLFDKSLTVGDFVELQSGVTGEVRDIKIRATRIVTNDNIDILVPNSEFVGGQVINWTHRDVSRRLRIPFGVAYGTDKDVVKRAALEAAAEVPFTLAQDGPRRPQVWLVDFGDSSLDFELVVWLTAEATKKPAAVNAAYNWALHSALQRYDLEIPFPQRDVNIRELFGLSEQDARRALRLDDPAQSSAGQRTDDIRGSGTGAEAEPEDSVAESAATGGNDAIEDVSGASAVLPGESEDRGD